MRTFNPFDYNRLFDWAMRSLIREILKELVAFGPVENHFFAVTFDTTNPDVQLAQHIKQQYPQEIAIILQHQFSHLIVNENDFEVTLSFHGKDETIKVPFAAITNFSDPSTGFVLELHSINKEPVVITKKLPPKKIKPASEKPKAKAQVIDLDQFRHKKYKQLTNQEDE